MESRSPTYNSWQAMKKRCLNKKHKGYKDYGEKGITICDEWIDSYQNFKRDMGEKPENHSLDRIDNSKGYIKGNVIVISRLANAMKNEANFEQLELFSENILKLINFYKNQGALGSITDVFDNFSPKLSLDS